MWSKSSREIRFKETEWWVDRSTASHGAALWRMQNRKRFLFCTRKRLHAELIHRAFSGDLSSRMRRI
jgi:hypothetical protein